MLHEFVQHADRSCELVWRGVPDQLVDAEAIEADLRRVLGDVKLELRFGPTLGERVAGKVHAYRSELVVED